MNKQNSFKEKVEDFIRMWASDADSIEAHTSGSTGTPKQILLPRQLVKESAWRSIQHFGLTIDSTVHLILSPDYIAGKMAIVRALEAGCRLTAEEPSSTPLQSPDTPADITLLSAVGAQIEAMYSLYLQKRLPQIHHLLLGGSPLTSEMREKAMLLATHVWESYGMTETASHIALRPILQAEENVPVPFTPLEGIKVYADSRQCLVIEMPVAGKVITNDIVTMYPDGKFLILGRYDNVIISGGLKIVPEMVEQRLSILLENQVFYVTSKPHPKWGEELIIVLENPSCEQAEITTFRTYFAANQKKLEEVCSDLQPHEIPKKVMTVPSIERTATGKIIRKKF